jgi:hypothetical protein
MEGPVRSTSRMPTECPARDSESASWVVTEDLPTPPLPERTCGEEQLGGSHRGGQSAGTDKNDVFDIFKRHCRSWIRVKVMRRVGLEIPRVGRVMM